ncbi:hypothetical protein [Nonomuraea basaltis]|uniref:hypothetical protein n=1 Tax=Nonomuraea basaltis TaxID=2495887 RepID=UPI001486E42E|nr:hypothetical protein [Nonomuraea basaltis]
MPPAFSKGEAMLRQSEQVRRRMIDDGLDRGADARDALRRFLRATVAELDTNPLYRRCCARCC